jgi:hypothetical protein
MEDELDECYGCRISEDEEELTECPDCTQMCCEPCLGDNCACE